MSRSRTVILLAAITLPMALPGAPAEVQSPSPEREVCAVGTLAVYEDERERSTPTPVVRSCFESLEEAVEFVRAGAPGDLERLSRMAGVEVMPTSIVLLGTVYKSTHLSGASQVYWGSGSGCYGVTFGFPSMPSGWDNAVYSAAATSGCWVTLYEHTTYGGMRINCTPNCNTMSTMAGRTSSIIFRPVGTLG